MRVLLSTLEVLSGFIEGFIEWLGLMIFEVVEVIPLAIIDVKHDMCDIVIMMIFTMRMMMIDDD